jgi:hypothetical protein
MAMVKKPCNIFAYMQNTFNEATIDIKNETNDEKKTKLIYARNNIHANKPNCVNTSDDNKIQDMLNELNNKIEEIERNNLNSYIKRGNDLREEARLKKTNGGKKRKTKKLKRNKKSRNNKR